MENIKSSEEGKLFSGIVRFNSKVLGLVIGFLMGMAIFIMTNWLIIKGGHIDDSGKYVVGPHLQLLSQFFIGYRVSFAGSLIGFAYGFMVGGFSGIWIGWIYNKIVKFKN